MDIHILSASVPNRMFTLVFAAGDEVCDGLLTFARQQSVTAASFTAIGALKELVVGFFDPAENFSALVFDLAAKQILRAETFF